MAQYPQLKSGQYHGDGPDLTMTVYGRGPYGFFPALPISVWNYIHVIESTQGPDALNYTVTETNSGTTLMVAAGLALVSGATSGNNTTVQMLRGFTVAANKHVVAFCRCSLANVAIGKGLIMGLIPTGADPIGTIPVDGAWFSKDTAGTGVIKARNTTGSADTTSATLLTATNGVAFDLCLLINGTTNVQYWSKLASAASWGDPTTHTTNLPTGALRYSLNVTAASSAAVTQTYALRGVSMEV